MNKCVGMLSSSLSDKEMRFRAVSLDRLRRVVIAEKLACLGPRTASFLFCFHQYIYIDITCTLK